MAERADEKISKVLIDLEAMETTAEPDMARLTTAFRDCEPVLRRWFGSPNAYWSRIELLHFVGTTWADDIESFRDVLRAARTDIRLGRHEPSHPILLRARPVGLRETLRNDRRERARRRKPTDVFIVHGHDRPLLDETSTLVRNAGLVPVVLAEEDGRGRTIIEKLEKIARDPNIGAAIVLLTPDDLGAAVADGVGALRARARQNALLECGLFMAIHGRKGVILVRKADAEIPTDLEGIEFTAVDDAGAWKARVAQRLVSAGLRVDFRALAGLRPVVRRKGRRTAG